MESTVAAFMTVNNGLPVLDRYYRVMIVIKFEKLSWKPAWFRAASSKEIYHLWIAIAIESKSKGAILVKKIEARVLKKANATSENLYRQEEIGSF